MELTKTWKQKTKSVGLAAVIGLASVGLGVAGNAAPAAANAPDDTVLCYASTSEGGQVVLLMEDELYEEKGCSVLRIWETTSFGSWKSSPYSYVGRCASGGDQSDRTILIDAVCGSNTTVITLSAYNNAGSDMTSDCIAKSDSGGLVHGDCIGMSIKEYGIRF